MIVNYLPIGSKNQDTGNTSGADQSPNGFNDQPDQHDLQAIQNHNLLIALGAARQSGAPFQMPVSQANATIYWGFLFSNSTDSYRTAIISDLQTFFESHFLRQQQQQYGDGDDNSNNSSLSRRRAMDDEDDMGDDDSDENDDSTNLPLNLVATQFVEWEQTLDLCCIRVHCAVSIWTQFQQHLTK